MSTLQHEALKRQAEKASDKSESAQSMDVDGGDEEEKSEVDLLGSEPLTAEEAARKKELLRQGFRHWTRRDHLAFIKGCELFGRNDVESLCFVHFFLSIAPLPSLDSVDNSGVFVGGPVSWRILDAGIARMMMEEHTNATSKEEVEEYADIFWRRFKDLSDSDRILARIQRGEGAIFRKKQIEALLRWKTKEYEVRVLLLFYFSGKLNFGHATLHSCPCTRLSVCAHVYVRSPHPGIESLDRG